MGLLGSCLPSQAEIKEFDTTARAFEPEIGRLEVAVNEAVSVGGGQSFGGFAADGETSASGRSALRLRQASRVSPWRYSIATYGTSPAWPMSWMMMMRSCLRSAVAWPSSRKRCRAFSLVRTSGLML